MPDRPPERESLAEFIRKRRGELGMTWQQVADAAGVSYETIRAARNDDSDIRPLTRSGIDRALRWEPGSVDAILAGGAPVPLDGEYAADGAFPGLPPAHPADTPNDQVEEQAVRFALELPDGEGRRQPWRKRRAMIAAAIGAEAGNGKPA